jgi:hypothetical protein
MLKLGQMISVLLEHLVDHLLDLGQREECRWQWVIGASLKDQAGIAGKRGLDRHSFDRGAEN